MNQYGIDPQQFRLHVVRPTLVRISLWSRDAENLVLGTCLKESLLQYIKQVGKGPALGVAQMEPATHFDLWENYLRYKSRLRANIVKVAGYFSTEFPDPGELIGNMNYAVAMCRAHYRRQTPPIPSDAMGLAQYWKIYYNTAKGKGDVAEAVKHFEFAVSSFTP